MNTVLKAFTGSRLLALAGVLALVGCGGGGGGGGGGNTLIAPAVSLSTATVAFGNQADGTTSAAQTVTVTNSGNATLTVSGVALSGTNAALFAQTNNCSSVAAGATCAISVTFTPTAAGSASASLDITSNASSSPDSAALTGTGTAPAASNTVAGVVDVGPASLSPSALNILYVSVTICAPGSTTNCQTIDHMQVDTGSTGIRVLSEVLSSTLAAGLTTVTSGAGHALVRCTQFGDGYSWGPIKTADVTIGGKTASNLRVQVIGDPAYPVSIVPSACKTGPGLANEEDAVAQFGANGIVGVSYFLEDCGPFCASDGTAYADCTATACTGYGAPLAEQTPNPVAMFASDNNGVAILLPAVPLSGGTDVAGTLVFGVGTQANNALPAGATVYQVTANGDFTAHYANTSLPDSFIDSGSNASFFPNIGAPALAVCASPNTSFYCPTTDTTVSAQITGENGPSATITVAVNNLNEIGATTTAFPGLAGTIGSSFNTAFDFGLPFFFGRPVYVVFEQSTFAGVAGPAVAF